MLTLFEAVCAGWTKDPEAFIIASPHPATKHLVCDGFGAGQVDHDLADHPARGEFAVRIDDVFERDGAMNQRADPPIAGHGEERAHVGCVARAAIGRLTELLFAEIR